MIVTRASQLWHGVWCLCLLAATGLSCGSNGTTGPAGTGGGSGSPGAGGDAGSAGTGGAAGATGSGGATGTGGASATAGTGGASATAGTSGAAGTGGTMGSAGAAGSAGRAGSAGASGGAGASGRGGATGGAGAAAGRGGTTGTAGAAGGAVPSAGCSSATTTPTSGRFMIDASGTSREYIIKIPAGYDARRPYRLILAFHGRMYDAASVDAGGPPTAAGAGPYYGIEPRAGGSAIFVAAQALPSSWTNANDIPYVNAMLARFKAELCIDQSRIFATGFSMGAIQTIALGCAQADVFRAIAPMSGSLQTGGCTGTLPIAYWGSHGTSDPTITVATGRMVRDNFRNRNHCTTTTVAGSPSGCIEYQGCDADKPVGWCEFDGMHQPPPYAGEAIWTFFSRF
jgi:polyhydroxybutyrate depolymerase